MGEKILVGNPVTKGLVNNRTAFGIDNDAFPVLTNAYQWRGRVKRKRGTTLLNRLQRYFDSTSVSYFPAPGTASVSAGGAINILTAFSLQSNGNIVPGSIIITDTTSNEIYTDPSMNGVLVGNMAHVGTINYATGAVVILSSANHSVTAKFKYYPDLPVMGLEDLLLIPEGNPGTLGFDTVYSYNILPTEPYNIYSVSFYKNPPSSGTYLQKSTPTPTSWNGQDYQQFWAVNYQDALWATNGITIPFTTTNVGMQFAPASDITYTSNTATTLTVDVANCPLVVGDFVFLNEWTGTNALTLNLLSGYVTAAAPNTPPPALKTLTITFPGAAIGAGPYGPGIIQYLTNRSDVTKDCLRWYDGDPTTNSTTTPVLNGRLGWVNFAPPLSNMPFNIADEPKLQYYLVGARQIIPFKDRLLFFGPVIQTSTAGSQVYLQDTVIYSQNGTPYYTATFNTLPTLATTSFNPILVPTDQVAAPTAYFEDLTGFGGFLTEGSQQSITTVSSNEDVLMVGFTGKETRFVYTGNDIVPFNFFTVNSEYGSGSTFSSINLDRGALKIGDRGIIISSQVASQRIDLAIPDEVFRFNLTEHGTQRVTAQRDFINEWVYFTYAFKDTPWKFPNQTLLYNYRDDSWGIFKETYTTYGQFRKLTGLTWATLPADLTWKSWDDPWNSGDSTLLQPEVIAGNQQGFVLFRDNIDTGEGNSLYIQNISGIVITSPDHCLNDDDFIVISGCLGTVGSTINGNIYQIFNTTTNAFSLVLSDGQVTPTGTYAGGGVIKRMYIPLIQTKQFPIAWDMARKTRIGSQQYLLSKTPNGQIELQVYLSQNGASAYNFGPVTPSNGVINDTLIYSDILFTCPESTNLGLTPANVNLQMPTASQQAQIWHRMNTSLIGDTVQLGFTMSKEQMRDTEFRNQFAEIELHAFVIDVTPSSCLA